MLFKEAAINPNISQDLVFVGDGDDRGEDKKSTPKVLKAIIEGKYYEEVKRGIHILSLPQKDKMNMGSIKHGALACAMRFAVDYLKADIIIYADGDMDPRQTGNLIGGIVEDGKDFVYGRLRLRGLLSLAGGYFVS